MVIIDSMEITEGNDKLVGIQLKQKDLQAIEILYRVRWNASISNWKERDSSGCMWKVSCPDRNNIILSEHGIVLAEVIENILAKI